MMIASNSLMALQLLMDVFIGQQHEVLLPCADRRRPLLPPHCCHSDERSDRERTNPTSYVGRASSRSDRGALLSRGGVPQAWRRPCLKVAAIRGREVAR